MTSIHCTDCPCYDENEPTICCSNTIRPKRTEGAVSYHFPPKPTERSADKYFDHENIGNC